MIPNSEPSSEFIQISNCIQHCDLLLTQLQIGRVDAAFVQKRIERIRELLRQLMNERTIARIERRQARLLDKQAELTTIDYQEVLTEALSSLIYVSNAARGFILMVEEDGRLVPVAARNFEETILEAQVAENSYSKTICREALMTQQSIVTTNASEDPRFHTQASIIGRSLRSVMAIPLISRGRPIGVVYLDNDAVVGLFDEMDLEIATRQATRVSHYIENAQLFTETDRMLAEHKQFLSLQRRVILEYEYSLRSLFQIESPADKQPQDADHESAKQEISTYLNHVSQLSSSDDETLRVSLRALSENHGRKGVLAILYFLDQKEDEVRQHLIEILESIDSPALYFEWVLR